MQKKQIKSAPLVRNKRRIHEEQTKRKDTAALKK